ACSWVPAHSSAAACIRTSPVSPAASRQSGHSYIPPSPTGSRSSPQSGQRPSPGGPDRSGAGATAPAAATGTAAPASPPASAPRNPRRLGVALSCRPSFVTVLMNFLLGGSTGPGVVTTPPAPIVPGDVPGKAPGRAANPGRALRGLRTGTPR